MTSLFGTGSAIRAVFYAAAFVVIGGAHTVCAQDKGPPTVAPQIKLVLPFGPGSGTDIYARLLAQHLAVSLNVPVIVENRPGANGTLAAEQVARAKPDGATFMVTTNTTHAGNPSLVKDLRYDPIRDFAPVSKLGHLTFFIAVAGNSPYESIGALIAAARRAPNTISYGAPQSLSIVLGSKLAKMGGVELLRVPYKSSPQVITDLLGGQITFAFADLLTTGPHFASGKARPLVVLNDKRFPGMPSVPTMKEAGFANFDVVAWLAMFAPAGTPAPMVMRMNREINAVLARPDVREKATAWGLDAYGSSPEELADYVASQIVLWSKLTADAGLTKE